MNAYGHSGNSSTYAWINYAAMQKALQGMDRVPPIPRTPIVLCSDKGLVHFQELLKQHGTPGYEFDRSSLPLEVFRVEIAAQFKAYMLLQEGCKVLIVMDDGSMLKSW